MKQLCKKKRFSRIIALLLTLILSFVPIPIKASAAIISSEVMEGFRVNLYDDYTLEITGYEGPDVDRLVIPEKITGLKVTKIGDDAFSYNETLKEVILPLTLTEIGVSAFDSCTALQRITIPGTVHTIRMMAFFGCTSLEEVHLLYGVQSIEDGAFGDCYNLKRVDFAPTVSEMHQQALGLETPDVEFATTKNSPIKNYVPYDGKKPTTSSLSSNSDVVYDYVVDENTGEVLIEGYYGDSTQPEVPSNLGGSPVTGIGDGAFQNKPVTTVKLPSTITTIGANAFAGTGLKNIEIPDSVTAIGSGAFDDGSNLTIKGGSTALDEYLKNTTKIQFIPYGPGATLYHELKLSASPAGGGSIVQGTARKYRTGITLTVRAVPTQGYRFAGWTTNPDVNADSVVTPNMSQTDFIMPNKDVTLTAHFEKIPPEPLYIRNGVVLGYYGGDPKVVIPRVWGKGGQEDKAPENQVTVHTIGRAGYNYGRVFETGYAQIVEIPDTITTIHEDAFYNASTLKAINVAKNNPNYSSIDGVLFNKAGTRLICYPMDREGSSYTIPSGVTSIAPNAFRNNKHLTSIHFGTVIEIGTRAFENCSNLESVTMPEVKTIQNEAFQYCTKLKTMSSPKVTTIGYEAFYNCYSLETFQSPVVQTIGTNAFMNCSSLNNIMIPKSIQSIGQRAFSGCSSFSKISWEEGVNISTLSYGVFSGCAFSDVNIPESVKTVSENAYAYCNNLTTVQIAATVTDLSSGAFLGCNRLSALNVKEDNPVYSSIDGILFNKAQTILMTYPIAKEGTSYVVPDTVSIIDTKAFGYTKLQQINLANTTQIKDGAFRNSLITSIDLSKITSIGSSAFYQCTNLTEITVPSGITAINTNTFANCNNLTKVTLPDSITSIGYGAFRGCSRLVEIILPTNLKTIGSYAFANCSQLAGINLPEKLTAIESYAFEDCSNLKTVGFSNNITSIGSYAFANCGQLTRIELPEKLTTIGRHAFVNCYKMQEAIFKNNLTTIGEYAFYQCRNLQSVVIPNSVATISNYAFSNCSSIRELEIKGAANLGAGAFSSCSKLLDLNLSQYSGSIGNSAFSNCVSLIQLVIPNSVKNIGVSAFSNCTGITKAAIGADIGSYAFEGDSKLEEVILQEGVAAIGTGAFSGTVIKQLNIPASVTNIAQRAFSGCKQLQEITVETANNRYASEDGVLYNKEMTSLITYPSAKAGDSYKTPAKVTAIESYAFEEADNLIHVTFGQGVANLRHSLFSGCDKIHIVTVYNKDAVFESKNTTPFEYVFYGIPSQTLSKLILEGYLDSTAEYEAFYREKQNVTFLFRPLDENLTKELLIDETGTVVGYTGNSTQIIVPSSVTKDTPNVLVVDAEMQPVSLQEEQIIPVRTIGKRAFWNPVDETADIHEQITSVKLPLSIRKIESSAFEGCAALTSENFEIPLGVTTIKAYAFRGCTGLTTVKIPKSVTVVGETGVPDEQTGLTTYVSAFYGCTSLEAIQVDTANSQYADIDGVLVDKAKTDLYEVPNGFKGNQAEEGHYIIPSCISAIGDSAFMGSRLKKIEIPTSIEHIGIGAFRSAFQAPTETTIKFMYDPNQNGIVDINNQAFKDCTGLVEVEVPQTIERFGDGVFDGCTNLKKITITTVDAVGGRYFSQDGILYAYALTGDNTYTTEVTHLLKYPAGKTETTFVMTDSRVKEIYKNAFQGCTALQEVTINDEVQLIDDYAFNSCTMLKTVVMPKNIARIGVNAFSNTNVQFIELPEGLNEIDAYAFANAKIGQIKLPDSLEKIGEYAFYDSSMTELVIPASVSSIGSKAFETAEPNRYYLTRVTFKNPNTVIAPDAFYLSGNFTVYGYTNSTAQQYAAQHGIPFIPLDTPVSSPSSIEVEEIQSPEPEQNQTEQTEQIEQIEQIEQNKQEENKTEEPVEKNEEEKPVLSDQTETSENKPEEIETPQQETDKVQE